ncbi:MAG TPA: hypothetical protein PK668_26340 [Myxococcota bacterium]|nr:hypothetical protein [Myxococcota bacterium]HRY97047.1 hypothetical protein [Myxococcota bacterium]HSA24250.1 hypothetical protein [Myxococcota bacterium]
MTPSSHVLLFAVLQVAIGLAGLITRRTGEVAVVSGLVMLSGVLVAFCALARALGEGPQAGGVVVLLLLIALAVVGLICLYAFHRYRRAVVVDEHDRMRR